MSASPAPISGLVLLTPKQKRFVQEVNRLLENDPLLKESLDTVKSIFSNILKHPEENKYRRLKNSNQKFYDRVGSVKTAVKLLETVGFELKEGEFQRHGILQEEDVWELKTVLEVLSNPNVPIKAANIVFCGEEGEWGEFSNFFLARIMLDNKPWATTEHYFQAQKFAGSKYEEEIRNKHSPAEAKIRGCDRTLPLRKDWETVKEDIMYKANLAKFSQHDKLKQKLLSTGNATIVEHTADDKYWGDGGDGSGKNRLGFILMKVRQSLQSAAAAAVAQKATPTPTPVVQKVAPVAAAATLVDKKPTLATSSALPAQKATPTPANAQRRGLPTPPVTVSKVSPAPTSKVPTAASSSAKPAAPRK